jgi:hypothetical protein
VPPLRLHSGTDSSPELRPNVGVHPMRTQVAAGILPRVWTRDVSPRALGAHVVGIRWRTLAGAIGVIVAFAGPDVCPALGTSWSVQAVSWPKLAVGQLDAVSCSAPGACMAVGFSPRGTSGGAQRLLAERWDGSSWVSEATPEPAGASSDVLKAVSCTSASACEAVGSFIDATGLPRGMVEQWNGSAWRLRRTLSEDTSLDGVSCRPSGLCMAVGGRLIERWSGSRWSTSQAPAGSSLMAVSCTGPQACSGVGSRRSRALAGHWNGKRWLWQLAPKHFAGDYGAPGLTASVFTGVACSSARACTAVGSAITHCGICQSGVPPAHASLAERWNGRRWMLQYASAFVVGKSAWVAVSCPASNWCMAVGLDKEGRASSYQWNGSRWTGYPLTRSGSTALHTRFVGLSCASMSSCHAIGSAGFGVTAVTSWDGSRWRTEPPSSTPNQPAAGAVSSVSCASDGSCTAVGSYEDAFGSFHAVAVQQIGATWSIHAIPGAGPTPFLKVSCASRTACVAVGGQGTQIVERWNGVGWSAQNAAIPPDAYSWQLDGVSCTSADACTVVGRVSPSGAPTATLAERWDGTRWTIQNTPNPVAATTQGTWLSGVSCTSAIRCMAVGGGNATIQAEQWEGSQWSLQQTPASAAANGLGAVSCATEASCMAVGPGGPPQLGESPIADIWNGMAWSAQATPTPPHSKQSDLRGVSCASATACSAVGYYLPNSGNSLPLAESWNGASWIIQPVPIPNGSAGSISLYAVSCTAATDCLAVGAESRRSLVQSSRPLVERLS